MSVSSSFFNAYAAGRKEASRSQAPCPEDASAETKLGYIAERARSTPDVEVVKPLLDQLSPTRRGVVSASLHAALMNKHLIGSSVSSSHGQVEKALVEALLQGARSI